MMKKVLGVSLGLVLVASIGASSCASAKAPLSEPRGASVEAQDSQPLGKRLVGMLGKDQAFVLKQLGKGEIKTVKEYDYLKDFGAESAVFYYGKSAMPDDYLNGLTFAGSMTCFFDKKGCFIGLLGIGSGTLESQISTIESQLGIHSGKLKLGKTLLQGKSLVRELIGGPVKMYATSWGADAAKNIGALWLSKESRTAKQLASSF